MLEPLNEKERHQLIIQKLKENFPKDIFNEAYLWRFYQTYKNNQRAAERYRPQYRGAVKVFCCQDRDRGAFVKQWKQSGIPYNLVDIPGNHESLMFPPNVQVLAAAMGESS